MRLCFLEVGREPKTTQSIVLHENLCKSVSLKHCTCIFLFHQLATLPSSCYDTTNVCFQIRMPPVLSKQTKIALIVATIATTTQPIFKKKKRKEWAKFYLRDRKAYSHVRLIRELDDEDFKIYLRLSPDLFQELLSLVKPHITKKDTHLRAAVTAEERLLATLKYLTSGRDLRELKFCTSISSQLLSEIIPETCQAIFEALKDYIKVPETEEAWLKIAKEFETKWQFHHCLGSIDGKHILIEKPPNSGSLYYNYKGTFSIVLLGIVNANYEFLYINVGTNGSISDGGVFKHTSFYKKLSSNQLDIPAPAVLPGSDIVAPYCFVADSAFAINENLLKPYPQRNLTQEKRIFNYRLSRARRVVENAFGILSERFRIFKKPITINVENVPKVVMATCALHNYLRKTSSNYVTTNCVDGEDTKNISFRPGDWRRNDISVGIVNTDGRTDRQRTAEGNAVRQKFTEYFNNQGRVDFQERMINLVH
ncbi:uncharacterized protein LOC134674612 [Cydia fagiglandana]|uniref:uncharacterized protein LOC134674612 n=1 Tax=Cydia fagiglandana TaxID=1458189 RepID=UPI002FEE2ECF